MSHKEAKRRRKQAKREGWEKMEVVLARIMRELRGEMARRLKRLRGKYPNHAKPCDTCAFRSSTDGFAGFELTVINFTAALADDRPFYCHHGLDVDSRGDYIPNAEMAPCVGWMILQSTPPLDPETLIPRPVLDAFGQFVRERHEATKMPDDPALEKGTAEQWATNAK